MQTRPQFTVQTERTGYDANVLSIVWDQERRCWALSFVSSGCAQLIPVAEIKEVRFHPDGASWCPFCDGPVTQHSLPGD